MNTRLGVVPPDDVTTMTKDDFIAAFKYIIGLECRYWFH